MHVAGSGLHQPTAQSRIFERLFDVHSEAEDLSALSFWSAFAFGFSLETESLGGFETGLTGFAPQLFEQDGFSSGNTLQQTTRLLDAVADGTDDKCCRSTFLEVACTTPRESMVAQTATSTNSQRRTQKWHREGSRMW